MSNSTYFIALMISKCLDPKAGCLCLLCVSVCVWGGGGGFNAPHLHRRIEIITRFEIYSYIITLYSRQLLKQHRIRIHVNLFLTFILTNASWLWWDYRVFRDRLESSQDSAFMHSDSVRFMPTYLYGHNGDL